MKKVVICVASYISKEARASAKDPIEEIDIEQSNLSQHLGILKKQGLIDSRKDGQRVIYWIAYPSVIQLVRAAEQTLSEQIGHSQSLLKYIK
jgi:ArsR family transcriptional regulator